MKNVKFNIKSPIYLYVIPIAIAAIGLVMIYNYYSLSKGHYINYVEDSNVDYVVCLKDNKFYENRCVEKGNQYVASLIDYIPANFNYKLDFLDGSIEYVYNYKIVAEFNVLDNDNDKVLYTKEEVIYTSEDKVSSSGININYNLNIDYNKYNNLLSSFISVYDLSQTKNSLKVSMDVDIKNKGNSNIDLTALNSSKATSITIPLTTKTVNVDISGTALGTDNNRLVIKPEKNYVFVLVLGVIFVAAGIGLYVFISLLLVEHPILPSGNLLLFS